MLCIQISLDKREKMTEINNFKHLEIKSNFYYRLCSVSCQMLHVEVMIKLSRKELSQILGIFN